MLVSSDGTTNSEVVFDRLSSIFGPETEEDTIKTIPDDLAA